MKMKMISVAAAAAKTVLGAPLSKRNLEVRPAAYVSHFNLEYG
tara:strand:- start:564 stop:692 length:129 start_codon:yes stop_codon:yes gene_type:complete